MQTSGCVAALLLDDDVSLLSALIPLFQPHPRSGARAELLFRGFFILEWAASASSAVSASLLAMGRLPLTSATLQALCWSCKSDHHP